MTLRPVALLVFPFAWLLAACSSDLFHDTGWATLCERDPSACAEPELDASSEDGSADAGPDSSDGAALDAQPDVPAGDAADAALDAQPDAPAGDAGDAGGGG